MAIYTTYEEARDFVLSHEGIKQVAPMKNGTECWGYGDGTDVFFDWTMSIEKFEGKYLVGNYNRMRKEVA